MIPQQGSQAELGLFSLLDETVPMPNEIAEISNVFRREPDTGDVTGPGEVGQQFGVSPVGFVGRLLHTGDVTGMGEFDGPMEFR